MTSNLADKLNVSLKKNAPEIYGMLSRLGIELYYPKGILTQSVEAKQKAFRYNATIGMATENGTTMHLPCLIKWLGELDADHSLSYAPSFGIPELRRRWLDHLSRVNPSLSGKPVSLPIVTSGVTHGLSIVADMFVDDGDTVLCPDKVWGNYKMIFGVRRGARMVSYPLLSNAGKLDCKGFSQVLRKESACGKLVVLLNFPNNPTGYSPFPAEAAAVCDELAAAAERGCKVLAVCDDAYFGLCYEPDVLRESLFTLLAGRHPSLLAIKLDGATKEDFVWGLRVAFVTISATAGEAVHSILEAKIAGCIRGTISNCSHLSQRLILRAMESPTYEAEKAAKVAVLQRRAATVKEVLSDSRFDHIWKPYPFNSGYFMCLKLHNLNAEAYRRRLLEKYGIGVIATSPTDIRVAFSSVEEKDIPDLFDQMSRCALEMMADHFKAGNISESAFEE